MKCTNCNQREASIHIQSSINGKTQRLDLCPTCAQQLESEGKLHMNMGPWGQAEKDLFNWDPFSTSFGNMQTFWQNFFGAPNKATSAPTLEKEQVCPNCGTTWSSFKRTGKLGCQTCYETFSETLPNLIEKLHGAEAHQGKVPEKNESHLKEKSEKEKLQSALEKAISEEAYEEAAQLRDAIRALEQKAENKVEDQPEENDEGADEA